MPYVDGYVVPVVAARFDEYARIATESAALWKSYGALSVVEARADDVALGEVTSFPRSVQLEEGEIVVFSYLTFRDRAHRDEVIAKCMADPRMNELFESAPVNGRRMIWGGFEMFVNA